jgi:two-component system, NarL family, invasion response regulator UvrY
MRILIADDHPIVRHGLKQYLASDPELSVIGEATNGSDFLELARKTEWDVALMDFTMPGRSGLELLSDLKREFPERPVLVLSIHSEQLHATSALKAGAAGYITKESAPQELAEAIRKVSAGGRYVSPQLGELLATEIASGSQRSPHETLSDREYRVMWMLASGKQINAIAREMTLSPSTVSTYRTRILKKLHVKNNAELVHYAVRHQLVGDAAQAEAH